MGVLFAVDLFFKNYLFYFCGNYLPRKIGFIDIRIYLKNTCNNANYLMLNLSFISIMMGFKRDRRQ